MNKFVVVKYNTLLSILFSQFAVEVIYLSSLKGHRKIYNKYTVLWEVFWSNVESKIKSLFLNKIDLFFVYFVYWFIYFYFSDPTLIKLNFIYLQRVNAWQQFYLRGKEEAEIDKLVFKLSF